MAREQRVPQGGSSARPAIVLIVQILFFLNAVIWIAFGVLGLVRPAGGVGGASTWILPLLMFGNAAVLAVLGWFLGRPSWWAYYLALLALLVNIVLGITDQIGLWDMLVMALNAAMLVLLFLKRSWYGAGRARSAR